MKWTILRAADERKWISAAEAAMLQLGKRYFSTLAKERGYTRRLRGKGRAALHLRKEIDSWADFRQMRRQWVKKYPVFRDEKRYTEKY